MAPAFSDKTIRPKCKSTMRSGCMHTRMQLLFNRIAIADFQKNRRISAVCHAILSYSQTHITTRLFQDTFLSLKEESSFDLSCYFVSRRAGKNYLNEFASGQRDTIGIPDAIIVYQYALICTARIRIKDGRKEGASRQVKINR